MKMIPNVKNLFNGQKNTHLKNKDLKKWKIYY